MGQTEHWPRLVGGHVALDFANTAHYFRDEPEADILVSGDDLLAWFEHAVAPMPAGRRSPRGAEVAAADPARLRAALRDILEALARGERAGAAPLGTLQAAYADAVSRATAALDEHGLTWASDGRSPRSALDEIVRTAVDLLRSARTDRIRECPGCGFLFLDATKNGSRRWCSMDDCGTREKVRRYVSKRAASTSGARPASS